MRARAIVDLSSQASADCARAIAIASVRQFKADSRSCCATRICDLIRSSSARLNSTPLFVARAIAPLIVKSASSNCLVLRRPSAKTPMKPRDQEIVLLSAQGFQRAPQQIDTGFGLIAGDGKFAFLRDAESTVRCKRVSSGIVRSTAR